MLHTQSVISSSLDVSRYEIHAFEARIDILEEVVSHSIIDKSV